MDNDLSDKSKSNTNSQNTKINLEKNRKINRHFRKKENRIKSENMTDIMSCLTKTNLLKYNKEENRFTNINPINNNNNDIKKNKRIIKEQKIISSSTKNNYIDYKKNDRQLKINKDNSQLILDESFNDFNDAKILCEYNSTNDKSLNTKNNESNKNKISITPNISINKYNKFMNFEKNKKSNKNLDNDGFVIYEFDIENEQNYKINGVKTNNFDVKKTKDENLKFTFMKEEKESEISVSHASKIIIGNIDGYKDIIETDIKNNEVTHSKCFSNLINKNSNLTNLFNSTIKKDSEIGEKCQKEFKKKISNLSTLLKKESGGVTFNDCNFYDSFNMTNNLDGISSTITNNIINEKKIGQINIDSNISMIKHINNCENINSSNNNNNNTKNINNNIVINNQSKSNEILEKEDINTNCIIY